MDAIKIESTVPAEKIHHIIEEIPIKKDVNISYEEYENRFRYIFSLNKNEIKRDSLFLDTLTKFVEDMIIKFYADDLISANIDRKLGKLDSVNRSEIIEDVKEVLKSNTLFIKEKKDIKNEIFEYFVEYNTLIIDGYLNFRSKSYHKLIEKAIELVLGNFQLEVEYGEFIDMLKALVESQTHEIDTVNVVLKGEKYILMDSDFQKINNDHISMVLEDLYYDEVSDGDILLSTIIALSPKELIIHLGDKSKGDIISILEEIFEDRITICRDCKICNKYTI
ncbi:MAG: sporulation protein YtxC [Tissierella sp.]|uniref:sporulation protein YtxC n=1 Tax=Tissierella sp. TaxID=41274 RepID=UPI003F9DC576